MDRLLDSLRARIQSLNALRRGMPKPGVQKGEYVRRKLAPVPKDFEDALRSLPILSIIAFPSPSGGFT